MNIKNCKCACNCKTKKNRNKFEFITKKEWFKRIPQDVENEVWQDLFNSLIKPQRATKGSAGYDCFAPFTFTLEPNEDITVPTGIKAYMNDFTSLNAYPRSGHGFKYYIRLANTVGINDSDYVDNEENEGHIFVKIRNEGNKALTIEKGEAFCQLVFEHYDITCDDNPKPEKRVGGFGSTDKRPLNKD